MNSLLKQVSTLLIGAYCCLGCEPGNPDSHQLPSEEQPAHAALKISMADKPMANRILPRFGLLGPECGFDFERYDDITGQRRLIEANGGGVAVFDFDHDGWVDIFMTNGCKLPLRNDDHRSPSQLFRNLSALKFDRVTESSDLLQFGYSTGCAVGDYDSDGFDDLYVTGFGRNAIWRNHGDGTFTDVTAPTGTAVGLNHTKSLHRMRLRRGNFIPTGLVAFQDEGHFWPG